MINYHIFIQLNILLHILIEYIQYTLLIVKSAIVESPSTIVDKLSILRWLHLAIVWKCIFSSAYRI